MPTLIVLCLSLQHRLALNVLIDKALAFTGVQIGAPVGGFGTAGYGR